MFNKLITNKHLLVISVSIFGLILILAISYLVLTFSKIYQPKSQPPPKARQIEYTQPEFRVKTVRLKDLDIGCDYLILPNGEVTQSCGPNQVPKDRRLLSVETIAKLFSSLSQEDFAKLATSYFSDQFNFQIIIETTHGTKTITFNNQGSNPPPSSIQTLLDQLEEVQEEFADPTPPPPPTLPPSPTPPPSPLPSPPTSPNPQPSPTPYPTPYQSGNTLQSSFDCSTIPQTNVTVTNTYCLAE